MKALQHNGKKLYKSYQESTSHNTADLIGIFFKKFYTMIYKFETDAINGSVYMELQKQNDKV